MSSYTVKFNNDSNRPFQAELKKRIDAYFKDNKISKRGNLSLYIKSLIMISAYAVPFVLLCTGFFESKLIWLLLAILMGFSMATIGMCVMHDANHGSYSKSDRLNKIVGFFSMAFLAGNALNWKIQHNLIHHTFTNVHDHDEDISSLGFLRFDPHDPHKKIHRFQFLYAWFFYGLMTLMWSTVKDFKQVIRYNRAGYLKDAGTTFGKELTIIIVSKILYYLYMLIPYFLVPEMTFGNWLIGYVVLHYVAGLTLALVFQLAHVTAENHYPLPESGMMETSFVEHQLMTTMNFATQSRVVSYLVGGLNFQVEHHLFPAISHIHYPKISKIVEQTTKEYNIPYHSGKSFGGALIAHTRMLKQLGKA